MGGKGMSLESIFWENYIKSHSTAAIGHRHGDIFELIETAIAVAATERPQDFKRQRPHIADLLFSNRPQDFFFTATTGGSEDSPAHEDCDHNGGVVSITKESELQTTSGTHDQQSSLLNELVDKKVITTELLRGTGSMATKLKSNKVEEQKALEACPPTQSQPSNVTKSEPQESLKQSKIDSETKEVKPSSQQKQPVHSDRDFLQLKLEATKRKLEQGYKQALNARKKIRMVELQDLPRQELDCSNVRKRFGNRIRR